MAQTESTMTMQLGAVAPDFILPDTVSGTKKSLQELKSDKATVVMFICNHCPFVKHIQKKLTNVANEYISRGVSFIAINSNDAESYPDDSPARMKEIAAQFNYPFPYLFDETQDVARAYHAACTPDIYVFDKDLKCVYRGQFDDSRPQNGIPVSGSSLTKVLNDILTGKTVSQAQIPSIGCSIKWKS